MSANDSIRPWGQNPCYWQYRQNPVLLLGGSKEDNLFQIDDLEQHLDEMVACGANYVRNTMSDRDTGNAYAWFCRDDGLYDLDRWNDTYWERFSDFLRLTHDRDIIVQIEVWDRFDYSDKKEPTWQNSPLRPANNINYDDSTGLPDTSPLHPSRDTQPFFHTIPGMPLYRESLDIVRSYQERFVEKMLSYTLAYGHVLYCMSNETTTPAQWGRHWISLIKEHASARGVDVYCTDMFDDIYRGDGSEFLSMLVDNPDWYEFVDISQVNSRLFGKDHWDMCLRLIERSRKHPRPVNHTKIYSDGNFSFGSGTPQDGIERFWHNILLGSASARFHRPGAGIGLNQIAQACIRSARNVESLVKFWDLTPSPHYLVDAENDAAYCSAVPGTALTLFVCRGGAVELRLADMPERLSVHWFPVSPHGAPQQRTVENTEKTATVTAPSDGPYVAVIR